MAQPPEEPGMELPADPELHGRGEGPEEPGIGEPARSPGEEFVHASDEDGHRENRTHAHLDARPRLCGGGPAGPRRPAPPGRSCLTLRCGQSPREWYSRHLPRPASWWE